MKKILLIEDNVDLRENIQEILEMANYEVITAENGKIGVEVATQQLPDLIICDIMMPLLDGYGVLHLISKNEKTASIPFIFLTAKSERSDWRKGMELGADDYITKPFEESDLLNAIEQRLLKRDLILKSISPSIEGYYSLVDDAKNISDLKGLSIQRESRLYRKKDDIYEEGSHPKGLLYISKGKVKTYQTTNYGKEFITGVYVEGDFLGYTSLIQETTYPDSCQALEDTEVHLIPKKDFFDLLYKNAQISKKFIEILCKNVQETEKKLLHLAYDSVRKRVANTLLRLHENTMNLNIDQTIQVSREDLANMVGTATETLIRTLSDFKEHKWIDIQTKGIFILEPEALKKIKN